MPASQLFRGESAGLKNLPVWVCSWTTANPEVLGGHLGPDHAPTTTTPPPANHLYWFQYIHCSSGSAALKRVAESLGGLRGLPSACHAAWQNPRAQAPSRLHLGSSSGVVFPFNSLAPAAAPSGPSVDVSPILAPREKPAAPAKAERGVMPRDHRCCLLRDRAPGRDSQGLLGREPRTSPDCAREPAWEQALLPEHSEPLSGSGQCCRRMQALFLAEEQKPTCTAPDVLSLGCPTPASPDFYHIADLALPHSFG